MALAPGSRLGPYEIGVALGAGGMGEVYRARDTKLGREVAIKVLPDLFATDPERLARFTREAQTLASLNHPNIAHIHGLEETGGVRALVMELIEGDDLSQRIAGGPMPLDEALAIAQQIADALDAAHGQGIVHRDLKPANIKVRDDGTVKVLDFGLAKAMEPAGSASNVAQSPTITSIGMTTAGVILGTAAYMSPEQARGVTVDKRADIWAFGCVLFEMLAGRRSFDGELTSDVMASVLKSEPDYERLPPNTPLRLRALLQRCLEKDPKRRWRDAGDLRVELAQVRDIPARVGTEEQQRRPRLERMVWASAVLVAILITWFVAATFSSTRGTNRGLSDGLLTFEFSPPEGASLYPGTWMIPFAVSPDGRWLVYTATSDGGPSRLWIREMSSLVAQAMPGTEGAVAPFWSPDSRWVGFSSSNALYRVRIPGGTPQQIGRRPNARFASWGPNDVILANGPGSGLYRISVESGSASPVTNPDPSEGHWWPQFVGDGRRFLHVVAVGSRSSVYVASLDGGERELVMEMPGPASTIAYVPGYLFYVQDGVLWAQPLDETTLRVIGSRRRVASGVPVGGGSAPFSVSQAGVLAYWTQSLIQQAAQLQWMDRDGKPIGRIGTPVVYDGFDLAQDDSRVVAAHVGQHGPDVWIHDLGAGSAFPLAFNTDTQGDTVPIWSRDGTKLTFLTPRQKEGSALRLADASGNVDPIPLTTSFRNKLAGSWNASGDQLVFEGVTTDNGIDLMVFHAKDRRVESLPWNTRSNDHAGRLSPDDRWIAYVTDQSGRNEVWVAAYPSGQPRRQISQDGGTHPDWNGKGTELFYISGTGHLLGVPFRGAGGSGIATGAPTDLFPMPGPVDIVAGSHNMYKAAADGQRFLVAAKGQAAGIPPLKIIVNWRRLLEGE